MKDLIETQRVCFVATADNNERTNVSSKGSIEVVDDETLAFADLYSQKTRANLMVNPQYCLGHRRLEGFGGNPIQRQGTTGNIYNDVVCYLQTLPMKLPDPQDVVKIKIEEIFNLNFGK